MQSRGSELSIEISPEIQEIERSTELLDEFWSAHDLHPEAQKFSAT
ncbi:MAG: hypothetical protein R2762_25150 [Bryobacteraceae bacterium]